MKSLVFVVPMFCSMFCAAFVIFLVRNCRSSVERKFLVIIAACLVAMTLWWLSLFRCIYFPDEFVSVATLAITYIMIPVLFYHAIYYMAHMGLNVRFSALNYILPLPVSAIILSMVVLIDHYYNGGTYGEVSLIRACVSLFIKTPVLRFAVAAIYSVPSVVLMLRCYKQVAQHSTDTDEKNSDFRIVKRITIFVFLSVSMLLAGIIFALANNRPGLDVLWLNVFNAACMMLLETLLIYHIVNRRYLTYDFFNFKTDINKTAAEMNENSPRRRATPPMRHEKLNKKALENYFYLQKPYVNPDFSLVDLAEAMDVSRTKMSNFINQAYDMNFKRYINRWRLDEYSRIMSLPSNERKNPYRMLPLAGFTDSRHYMRALQAEKEFSAGESTARRNTLGESMQKQEGR